MHYFFQNFTQHYKNQIYNYFFKQIIYKIQNI